jgi:ribosomal RNA-processing protein 7
MTVSTQLIANQLVELMELKRKWEEDKAKVEKLKASRRFKPY